MIRRRRRSAYTLLEILLALTIAVFLLAALYSAVGYQLRQAQAGRDVTSQTTLNRSIINRIETDVVSSLALCDPGRFRNQQLNAQAQQAKQQSAQSTSGQTTSGQTTSGQKTSTQKTSATSGSGATGSGTAPIPVAQPADATDDSNGTAGQNGPVVLPCGVIGTDVSLTLFISKVPSELYGVRGDPGQLVSDIRKITYWIADNGVGLCRQEVRVATSEEALSTDTPSGDAAHFLLAPEVKSIAFRYFDGSDWTSEWNSTLAGDGDGITPVGAPRAIEVRIGVLPPDGKDGDELKYLTHVIAISTANGITQANAPGTTP